MAIQITTMQILVNMEMRFMKRARAVAVAHRGTAITLSFLTRAVLSSIAGAVTVMVRVQACSISAATMVASATLRSVRSWLYFSCNQRIVKEMSGMSKILCNLKRV